jgi:hypothetical protein
METLVGMELVLRKPVVIAAIVAVIAAATLIVVNHTNRVIDRRPPLSPPGTTFNAVKDVGADMAPTEPESPIKVPALVPEPVTPASGRK